MIKTDCHIQGDNTENTQQSVKHEEKEKISRSFVTFIFAWKQSFLQNKVQKSSTNINFILLTLLILNYISSFCRRYFFIFNNLNIFFIYFLGTDD